MNEFQFGTIFGAVATAFIHAVEPAAAVAAVAGLVTGFLIYNLAVKLVK
jgi:UDP-N-acetylmuramyl pentapeptide phosphotransferase/UDP-N-acetylglucosamine-1-phosphate transferase